MVGGYDTVGTSLYVDGLVYFVTMTAINALNVLIFLNMTQPSVQGS